MTTDTSGAKRRAVEAAVKAGGHDNWSATECSADCTYDERECGAWEEAETLVVAVAPPLMALAVRQAAVILEDAKSVGLLRAFADGLEGLETA